MELRRVVFAAAGIGIIQAEKQDVEQKAEQAVVHLFVGELMTLMALKEAEKNTELPLGACPVTLDDIEASRGLTHERLNRMFIEGMVQKSTASVQMSKIMGRYLDQMVDKLMEKYSE